MQSHQPSSVGVHVVTVVSDISRATTGFQTRKIHLGHLVNWLPRYIQELIAGAFGRTGPKLYAVTCNLINQAVLGFTW